MAKKEKNTPEVPENEAANTPAEETAQEETFTVTREQMQQMEQLAKLLAEEQDKYLRLAAEYDNYRKRTAKEKEGIYANARIDTVTAFLGVHDNLERGIRQYEEGSTHRQGLEMIMKQFDTALESLGVTEIRAEGAEFDPNIHNAVMHIDDENYGENEVAQVFQAGFAMGDKIIRHAIVQVAN